MKDQTDVSEGQTGTATLSAGFWQGSVYRSGVPYVPAGQEATTEIELEAAAGHHAFRRKVGAQYVIQALLCSLPLLFVDLLALTVTVSAFRFLFQYFGFVVGIDVSAGLVPIATGFVLLNYELGLYPGVRLSPIEELRRLVVSITCMFIVWAVGVIVLTGGLTFYRSFLLVIYWRVS